MDEEEATGREMQTAEWEKSSPAKATAFASYVLVRKPCPSEDEVNLALAGLRKWAEYGDGRCLYWLGSILKRGRWAQQDLKEAARLFELASEKGVAGAEYELGVCYANGEGVGIDLAKAAECYEKAAKRGSDEAMLALSHCYRDGVGVEADQQEAVRWLLPASKRSLAALNELSRRYDEGNGVKQSSGKSAELLEVGSDPYSDPACMRELGMRYAKGDGVRQDRRKAISLYLRCIDSKGSLAGIGRYRFGMGIKTNFGSCIARWEKLASRGDAAAEYRLSECYFEGLGVERSAEEGYRHLQRAAELGNHSAELDLSIAYSLDGGYLKRDPALSMKWLTLSAKQGSRLALFFLGRRYLSGFLAPIDRKKGLDCLNESADEGLQIARYFLSLCQGDIANDEQDGSRSKSAH